LSMATFDAVTDDGDTIVANLKGCAPASDFVVPSSARRATNRGDPTGTWPRSDSCPVNAAS